MDAADGAGAACTYADSDESQTMVDKGCWRDPTARPEGLTLGGDAYLDDSGRQRQNTVGAVDDAEDAKNSFGVKFDGDGDFAAIDTVDSGYAADGTFSIAMWITKPACRASGKEELVYLHANAEVTSGAVIRLTYICSLDSRHQHSSAQLNKDGTYSDVPIMRAVLKDNDNNIAIFDWRMDGNNCRQGKCGEGGGYVTDTWSHIVLGVYHDHVTVHVNGRPVGPNRIGYGPLL